MSVVMTTFSAIVVVTAVMVAASVMMTQSSGLVAVTVVRVKPRQ